MKILFVIPSYGLGGTNTSLISLISMIKREKYALFIYAINNTGPLSSEMEKYAVLLNPTLNNTKTGKSLYYFEFFKTIEKKIFRLLRFFHFDLTNFYFKKISKSFEKERFDCIIAFQEGLATRLVSYCNAPKKVAWIRSEYKRYLSLAHIKPEKELYNKFDIIINVSQTALNQFLTIMPEFADKSTYLYNFLNKERVIEMSKEKCEIGGNDLFTIVSLGRVDPVKHFSEIPDIAKDLKDRGIHFRWIIIGGKQPSEVSEYEKIESKIKKYHLEKDVYLLGRKENPYKYVKNSDLLVCLSESETFNHTFGEARILGVPVLSVNYPSASEILRNDSGGLIVEREQMTKTLIELITDSNSYILLKKQAEKFDYDNERIINKLINEIFN